jgi:DNA-binding CsgD family transcriptional regulator
MYLSKNPIENNTTGNDPIFERPRISLLGEEHWLQIRKQYCISLREVQVAKLVCQGFGNEEIAGSLKIKQGTIKTHMRNIYRRVRVKNRIEMLLKFVDIAAGSSTKLEIKFSLPSNIKKPGIVSVPDASVKRSDITSASDTSH